ncbi:multidrug effflux MFS transporter [Streptomyces microflavus]|uniref:Multidrug effflux MFS transporter n=1 Tax=Streptomyces microflavus TaxID=1919 RepID=A0A6N9VJB6_STRMI|nr:MULTISPECIES: multidrug effflux MFS transporter [Streptomyces]MBK3586531.1 multidrug effflux MFS transporter [Streptomyces sp. MBT57]MBK5993865.1 multidrug effflux MFS transporter [Streptomyces sp. MBT58]NEB71139.1 multidrug effflux MFS transporter [Streptomyces microflavus]OXY88349.1 Bcr/CflA family drug resistance efflux transporter [Streptomyces sp. 2R]QQZ53752.1 multidrug effflux MFS transporter [Streptomyces microflavus]
MPDSGGSRAQREHIPTSGTGPGADSAPLAPHGDAGALSVDPGAPQVTAPAGLPAAPEAAGLKATRRTGFLVTMVLGGLTALPPLSMDMYLPALPAVTDSLSAPAATIQLTLTACLAGMALGQLVVGPMSDRWGRRRPLLLGMVVYVIATAICALAPSAELLIGFRLLQGLAGAAGIVIARAVVRDLYDGVEMARFFSTLMLISGVAPIIAPLIGGQVMRFTDWRGIFVVLTGIGIVLTLVVWKWLHETLEPGSRHTGGVGEALRTMRGLLADRVFTGYMVTGGLAFAVLFAYISASPFVVQEIYGASPQTFSLLFGLNSIGLIAVGQINGKLLVGRISLDKVLGFGLAVIVLAAVALLLMTTGVFGEVGLVPVAAGLFVLMSAMGVAMPNTNAQALMRTKHAAGSASALLGTSSFLIGAIASPLVGIAGEDTAVPMAVVQVVCAVAAVGCFLGLCRPWQRAGREAGGL